MTNNPIEHGQRHEAFKEKGTQIPFIYMKNVAPREKYKLKLHTENIG